MRFARNRFVARLLLAVMLTTFLSPSFAWHMRADHHEILGEAHSEHDHDHDVDHPDEATDDPVDAHASIGHLLGHLTMQSSRFEVLVLACDDIAPLADVRSPPLVAQTSPPYRPPLTIRLA